MHCTDISCTEMLMLINSALLQAFFDLISNQEPCISFSESQFGKRACSSFPDRALQTRSTVKRKQ